MANSVVTKYRREKLCQITSGAISSLPYVNRIAFGNGGVDASGNPVAPVETATALKNQIAVYSATRGAGPVSTTARYTVTIPESALAGQNINEAALMDTSGAICAIQTMYSKRKDGGVAFTFTFDDEF